MDADLERAGNRMAAAATVETADTALVEVAWPAVTGRPRSGISPTTMPRTRGASRRQRAMATAMQRFPATWADSRRSSNP